MATTPVAAVAGTTIVPCLRYRDAPAMIEWLCQVFGFTKQLVVPAPDGGIAHAQLCLGSGMIMLGSVPKEQTPYGKLTLQPDEVEHRETQACYLIVTDADAVLAKVIAARGKVLLPIKDEDYGGRGFTCADVEGHIWSVGTYDPWVQEG